jgi:hypothetical protein
MELWGIGQKLRTGTLGIVETWNYGNLGTDENGREKSAFLLNITIACRRM